MLCSSSIEHLPCARDGGRPKRITFVRRELSAPRGEELAQVASLQCRVPEGVGVFSSQPEGGSGMVPREVGLEA